MRGRIGRVRDGRLSMEILVLGNLMLLFYRREWQIIMGEDLNRHLLDCQSKLNQLKKPEGVYNHDFREYEEIVVLQQ